jgi:hypothetical protein
MEGNKIYLISKLLLLFIGISFVSCVTNSPANETQFAPEQYSKEIVGSWRGIVGDEKETMTINSDSSFVCHLRPMGFIANTLSQSSPGTVHGFWKIVGSVITLRVIGEKNVRSENKTALSTIVKFKGNSLTLKSDHGDISIFQRVRIL